MSALGDFAGTYPCSVSAYGDFALADSTIAVRSSFVVSHVSKTRHGAPIFVLDLPSEMWATPVDRGRTSLELSPGHLPVVFLGMSLAGGGNAVWRYRERNFS